MLSFALISQASHLIAFSRFRSVSPVFASFLELRGALSGGLVATFFTGVEVLMVGNCSVPMARGAEPVFFGFSAKTHYMYNM